MKTILSSVQKRLSKETAAATPTLLQEVREQLVDSGLACTKIYATDEYDEPGYRFDTVKSAFGKKGLKYDEVPIFAAFFKNLAKTLGAKYRDSTKNPLGNEDGIIYRDKQSVEIVVSPDGSGKIYFVSLK